MNVGYGRTTKNWMASTQYHEREVPRLLGMTWDKSSKCWVGDAVAAQVLRDYVMPRDVATLDAAVAEMSPADFERVEQGRMFLVAPAEIDSPRIKRSAGGWFLTLPPYSTPQLPLQRKMSELFRAGFLSRSSDNVSFVANTVEAVNSLIPLLPEIEEFAHEYELKNASGFRNDKKDLKNKVSVPAVGGPRFGDVFRRADGAIVYVYSVSETFKATPADIARHGDVKMRFVYAEPATAAQIAKFEAKEAAQAAEAPALATADA